MSDPQSDTVTDWPALSTRAAIAKPRASSAWQSREQSLSKVVKPTASRAPVSTDSPSGTPSLGAAAESTEVPLITVTTTTQQAAPRQVSRDSVSQSSLCVSDSASSEVSSTRPSPRAHWAELNKPATQPAPLSLAAVAQAPDVSTSSPTGSTPAGGASPMAPESGPPSRPRSLSATAPAFVVAPKSDTSSVSGSSGDRLSAASESPRFPPQYAQQQPLVYVMPPVVDPQYAQMLVRQQQQQQLLMVQEQQRSLAAILAMQKSINESTKRQIKAEAARGSNKEKATQPDANPEQNTEIGAEPNTEAPGNLTRTSSLNSVKANQPPRLQRARSLDESRHIQYLQSVVQQQKQMSAVVYMPAMQPASGNVPLSFVTPAGTTIYSQPVKRE